MLIKAVASSINEENIDLALADGLKVGDGEIHLDYYLEDYDRYLNSLGSITVYSNGKIFVDIDSNEYGSYIYKDYLKINGDNPEPLEGHIGIEGIPIVSEDFDKSRWDRVKKFIVDNNIELKYLEDINMDYAEYEEITYEDYMERNKKILEEYKNGSFLR